MGFRAHYVKCVNTLYEKCVVFISRNTLKINTYYLDTKLTIYCIILQEQEHKIIAI